LLTAKPTDKRQAGQSGDITGEYFFFAGKQKAGQFAAGFCPFPLLRWDNLDSPTEPEVGRR
jgi:hypothetical protein